MDNLKYCKLCLVTDIKMYSMNTSITEVYSSLLRLPLFEDLHYICYECVALLRKYQEFRSKCKQAHCLLAAILSDQPKVTSQAVKEINRKKYNLESKLMQSSTKTYNDQLQLSKDCTNMDEKFIEDENMKAEYIPEMFNNEVHNNTSKVIANAMDSYESELNPDYNHDISDSDLYVQTSAQKMKKRRKIKAQNKCKSRKSIETITDIVKNELMDECFSDIDNEPLAKRLSITKVNNENNKLAENVQTSIQKTTDVDKEIKEGKRKCGPKFDASYFEDYATVVTLTPEDARKEILMRKESSNYINCPFKCQLCYRGYEAKGTFENHMKRHSLEYGKWECEICHLRFPEHKALYKHQFTCHKRKFYCKICPYTCFCTHQARTHMSLHKGKKYPCKECGEIFSMPNSLLMHKRVKHLTQCVCALCGSTFATQRGLYSHKMLLHRQETNVEKGPKCEECGVQFATDTAWKRHLVLSSKHKVSNGCEFCGETFSDEESLKSHMKVHSRKQTNRADSIKLPAACIICDKWLQNRTEYKSHMTSLHPLSDAAKRIDAKEQIQCVCEVCGKVFKKQCFLLYHQRKHTGERPYECVECGKTYTFPGALSTHKTTHHSRGRVHQCHLCHKVFTFRSALNKHVKAHLGIRPHKCSICEKAFPNPCDVKVHMKYVHYKVPWPKRDRSKRGAEDPVNL